MPHTETATASAYADKLDPTTLALCYDLADGFRLLRWSSRAQVNVALSHGFGYEADEEGPFRELRIAEIIVVAERAGVWPEGWADERLILAQAKGDRSSPSTPKSTPVLTREQVAELRDRWMKKLVPGHRTTDSQLAIEFGVTTRQVRLIGRGLRWNETA